MSNRYAVLNSDDLVVNVIEAEDDFDPGDGLRLVRSDTAGIDDEYKARKFTRPERPAPEPTARERYAEATTQGQKLAVVAEELGLVEAN